MPSPRVIGYDDLHGYLESMAETEQDLADDLDDEGKPGADKHWAKAEAYREVIEHIEREHQQHYTKGEVDKLREQLAAAERRREWAETSRKAAQDQAQAAEYRRRAAVGQVTRIKKRVANGVCPCCKRTFANLARHMEGQHPDFAREATTT